MRLNFQREGIETGTPLLILHGMFGMLDNWAPIARGVGLTRPVISVDLRNHGRSPHSEVFDYPSMAEDLAELMRDQGLEKVHVLGHSMGGKVAMTFALNNPDLVERLIVVDMVPKQYPPAHLPIFEALLSLDLAKFKERHEVETALAPMIPETPIRKWLLKNVGRGEAGELIWKMNLPVIRKNYSKLTAPLPLGKQFDGPALFIKGGQSEYIQESDVALIAQLFPRTTFKTVNNAGHWVQADAPQTLITFTTRFLR